MNLSISQKLLIYFFLLSFAGVITIGTYSYFKARTALISRTYDQLTSLRIEKKNRIEDFFENNILDLSKLSSFEETKTIFDGLESEYSTAKASQNSFIKAFFHANEIYENITFYSANHHCIQFSVSDNAPQNTDTIKQLAILKTLYDKLEQTDIAVIDNNRLEDGKAVSILLGKRIDIIGQRNMIVLSIPIQAINHIMHDNNPINGLGNSGEAYLVGEDSLMRSTSRFQEKSVLITKVNTPGVKMAFEGKSDSHIFDDYRGEEVLSAFSPIDLPYLNWVILAEMDTEEAMISINLIRNSIIYLTLIISLLTLGVVALLSNAITLPIKALRKETEKISQGEYGKTIAMQSNDELGELITAFNEMTLKLDEQAKKLGIERKLRLTSMIDGQELERQRLSRELHDSLGQQILALKMRLENTLHAPPEQASQIFNESMELFGVITQEIRNISNNLMPAVLSEFGLETAINNLVREFNHKQEMEVVFNANINRQKLNTKVETYVFRICQEAINNITKYAKATSVNIELNTFDDLLILQIHDNGIGFTTDTNQLSKGNGLSNMKERTLLLNGLFTIESSINKGTKIEVEIPLTSNNTDL